MVSDFDVQITFSRWRGAAHPLRSAGLVLARYIAQRHRTLQLAMSIGYPHAFGYFALEMECSVVRRFRETHNNAIMG